MVDLKLLQEEEDTLKKDFEALKDKLQQLDKSKVQLTNNMNAVYGALQQVQKLMKLESGEKQPMPAEKQEALNIATS
tara:strand:- start:171 stop:401 length:231 start_codon:yes stop_codon:yes gene_type:complete